MILGFKTQWNGKATHFPEKIMACTLHAYRKQFRPKLHTIRAGDRWKPRMEIHMATGVRTKNYKRFNAGAVGLQYCLGVQKIEIFRTDDLLPSERVNPTFSYDYISEALQETFTLAFEVHVDGRPLERFQMQMLASNDGFESVEQLLYWFNLKSFTGQIIHWTTLRY